MPFSFAAIVANTGEAFPQKKCIRFLKLHAVEDFLKHKTPQSHIPVVRGAAIVANTGKAGAGEKYFRRWDGDGIGEFSIFGGCEI